MQRSDNDLHQNTMSKELKDLPVRRNLPLHLILNLRPHKRKLLLHFMRMQIPPDPAKLAARLLDLPASNKMARRVRHERNQSEKHDDTPWDLDT